MHQVSRRTALTCAAAMALLALMTAAPAQAAWLQAGGNPSQTGAADSGPRWNETALEIQLPGPRPPMASPLVLNGGVYALTGESGQPTTYGILRVDLETGVAVRTHSFNEYPFSFASDGQRLIVVHEDGVRAYETAGGSPTLQVPWTQAGLPALASICTEPVLQDGSLIVACAGRDPPAQLGSPGSVTFVAKVDLARAVIEDHWSKSAGSEIVLGAPGPDSVSASGESLPLSVSQGDGMVLVVTHDDVGRGGAFHAYVWALRETDLSLAWSANSQEPPTEADVGSLSPEKPEGLTGRLFYNSAVPPVAGGAAFIKFQNLHRVQATTGDVDWKRDARASDAPTQRFDYGTGLAVSNGTLYATTQTTLSAYDAQDGRLHWTSQPLEEGLVWHSRNLIIADDTLYAVASRVTEDPDGIHVLDGTVLHAFTVDGRNPSRLLWKYPLPEPEPVEGNGAVYTLHRIAASEGVMAAQSLSGKVTVVGRAAASIQPVVSLSTPYPAVGEPVVLDLAATRPGALARDLEFRIDWGDGESTSWDVQPAFTHRYAQHRDYTALVYVRNSAGQLSIHEELIEAGRVMPEAGGIVQRLFDADNQDKTFFAIGTLMTLVGAIFGFSRVHNKRSLLAKELTAVEDAYLMTNHIPLECEQALSERKAHARGLLLDGKVTESQFAILDHRIDELRSAVRVNTLEESFDFMPVGLMKRLQRILADGHVTKNEHDDFLSTIRRNRIMTRAQKERVQGLVSRWFARDQTERWGA